MYHFVAFIWNRENPAPVAAVSHLCNLMRQSKSRLTLTLDVDGIKVFTEAPRTQCFRLYRLPIEAGIVLGRLFHYESDPTVNPGNVELGELDASAILNSHGQQLVDRFWGSYVAFLTYRGSGRCIVVRSCSGWIPCYRMKYKGVEIIFSDLADLTGLLLPPFTLNRRYLAAFIYFPSLQIRECGYSEVTEILAGECVELYKDTTRQFALWDPRVISSSSRIDDYDWAEARLQSVTQQCISAWGGVYDHVLLSLSGGFDSAVVLGCLIRAPKVPGITCLNQCIENTLDDERVYARLAARNASVTLIERSWSEPLLGEHVFAFPKAPKPCTGHLDWWLEVEQRNEVAESCRADTLWTGQGGDHLFWAPRNFPITADYVARHGLDLGFLGVVRDEARLFGNSYLSIIRTALILGRSSNSWIPDEIANAKRHFVNSEAIPTNCQEYISHPWVSDDGLAALPKTKQAQVRFLADVLNRHRHFPRAEYAYQEHPLLSQPIIDLCLQIPNYLLVQGGRRRAMARRAFRNYVPKEIIDRDDKGDTTARVRTVIRKNQKFLSDILIDGILVREGIISRAALQRILVDGHSFREDEYWPFRACITGEIWARAR